MKTHPLALVPQSWMGRNIALLDAQGAPFASGRLIAHDVRHRAACGQCGNETPVLVHVGLEFAPRLIGYFDLQPDVRVAAAEVGK